MITFRERVDRFWRWWAVESTRLLAAVDEDGGASIQEEVSAAVNGLGEGLGWVFGPGKDGAGHSFTISTGGNVYRRVLIDYWLGRAPELEGGVFYPSRQPHQDIDGIVLRLGDEAVKANSIWMVPTVDYENEEIDVTAWCPAFEIVSEDQAMQILFIYLDAALGEDGTEHWLGSIKIGKEKLDASIPVAELPDYIDTTFAKNEWEKRFNVGVVYELKEALGDFPRGDILIGSTGLMGLVNKYFNEQGPVEDPLEGFGVHFAFIQLPRSIFPEGGELAFRGELEEALSESLENSGDVTGGAIGSDACYIDLVLFDEESGKEAIAATMAARNLTDTHQVFSFVKR